MLSLFLFFFATLAASHANQQHVNNMREANFNQNRRLGDLDEISQSIPTTPTQTPGPTYNVMNFETKMIFASTCGGALFVIAVIGFVTLCISKRNVRAAYGIDINPSSSTPLLD